MQRTSIYLDDQDRDALRVIREAHGIASDASAIRFAVRSMARDLERKPRRGQSEASDKAARTDD
jgi:hypothetical protein